MTDHQVRIILETVFDALSRKWSSNCSAKTLHVRKLKLAAEFDRVLFGDETPD